MKAFPVRAMSTELLIAIQFAEFVIMIALYRAMSDWRCAALKWREASDNYKTAAANYKEASQIWETTARKALRQSVTA